MSDDFGDWSARPSGDSGGASSGNMFSTLSGAVGGISGAVGSLFSANSYKAEAGSYRAAAAIAGENARLTEESADIKQYQQERMLNKSLGSIRAEQAGAGFAEGGTGMYILRDSTAQGHLANAMIGVQGQINENAYLEQEQRALGEAKAADSAASKATGGGFMSFLGTGLSLAKGFL